MFTVVRRSLAVAGLTGLLLLGAGPSFADDPTPGPQPSTTTDCGLPPNDGGTAAPGQPAPDTGTATIAPSEEPATPGLDPGVICIASGVNTGGPKDSAGGGEVAVPVAAPAQLPRTGPAPLLPTAALGGWLLLIGTLAVAAGRRRAARTDRRSGRV